MSQGIPGQTGAAKNNVDLIGGVLFWVVVFCIMALIDAAVRGLPLRSQRYRVFDSARLLLEVDPAGGKYWLWRHRFPLAHALSTRGAGACGGRHRRTPLALAGARHPLIPAGAAAAASTCRLAPRSLIPTIETGWRTPVRAASSAMRCAASPGCSSSWSPGPASLAASCDFRSGRARHQSENVPIHRRFAGAAR